MLSDLSVENRLFCGVARKVLLRTTGATETFAVAVIGESLERQAFSANVFQRRPSFGNPELSELCYRVGELVAEDYLSFRSKNSNLLDWETPLEGVELDEVFSVEGQNRNDLVVNALRHCALFYSPPNKGNQEESVRPSKTEESIFRDLVKRGVLEKIPSLLNSFNRDFSLTASRQTSNIDFVGSFYATCFAAVNPKANRSIRMTNATSSLWRLARARDAFGFAAPQTMELTAWVPPKGLPLFTDHEYQAVEEVILELDAQARTEGLTVFSAETADDAIRRVVQNESIARSS